MNFNNFITKNSLLAGIIIYNYAENLFEISNCRLSLQFDINQFDLTVLYNYW